MQQQALQTRKAVIEVTDTDYARLMSEIGTLRAELRMIKGAEDLPPLPGRQSDPDGGLYRAGVTYC